MRDEKRFAVLIDADNISAKYIKYILDEITNYGVATYKRIYGDWTSRGNSTWKTVLLDNSINPIQQYSYTQGKNATDAAMIIDAMDILYSENVDGFCIVSSDSDFTKLSSRLRESGMLVVGMGEKKTPKPFIASCNEFKYLDVLAETEEKSLEKEEEIPNIEKESESNKANLENTRKNDRVKKETNKQDTTDRNIKTMTDLKQIQTTIMQMMDKLDGDDQSMNIGELGSRLVKRYPDFDVRNYGYTKLSKFLKHFDFIKIDPKKKNGIWVTLKNEEIKQEIKKHPKKAKRKRRNYRKK
ncbi:NYN domain-containing protein [Haloplasma contractile]|uniref:OST-HTH/LOTUS domain protein n=1 Tax=Haloplasma contractile SSD-17B TaxID=1033810 RepID=U2EDV5_9MOLU|nr:NYN domain-containing protein [Haloplasma contractile]ERJ13173.1 OST-HTH/LOTUS domain protein [Haloplasma contractile SSD-17B]